MISAARVLKRLAAAVLASALLAVVLSSAASAAWPDRAITIIVPFPEGGDSDLLGRVLATHLAPIFGQKVTVKNIAGGAGSEGLRTALAEAGIADEPVETSLMFAAPAGTPSYVIDMLARATQQILQQADVKADLRNAGFAAAFEGPEEMHERVLREIPMWHEIVERVGLSKK